MDRQKIVNLTPHTVCVSLAGAKHGTSSATFYPSGTTYRLAEEDEPAGYVNECPSAEELRRGSAGSKHEVRIRHYSTGGLPPQIEGCTWIVSLPALMALAAVGVFREDVVAPDTGPTAIRDKNGQIKQVRGFVRLAPQTVPITLDALPSGSPWSRGFAPGSLIRIEGKGDHEATAAGWKLIRALCDCQSEQYRLEDGSPGMVCPKCDGDEAVAEL